MTTTPYSDIFDIFMMQITDYRLIDLYRTPSVGVADFEEYLTGFLVLSIPEFYPCSQNLSDRDDTSKLFNFPMSADNKVLLSKFMVKQWLKKEIHDILQMRLHVQDVDFRTFAEANNLNAKQNTYNILTEECSQALVDYGFKNTDWASWRNQNFEGS